MYTWIEIPENELKEMFMNYSVTAEKMYVHINTIRKKIDKVNDLVKIDWPIFPAVRGAAIILRPLRLKSLRS